MKRRKHEFNNRNNKKFKCRNNNKYNNSNKYNSIPGWEFIILKIFNFEKNKKQIKESPIYMPLKAFFKVTGIYLAILFIRPTLDFSDELMNLVTKIYKVLVTITIANSLAKSMTKKSRFIKAIK